MIESLSPHEKKDLSSALSAMLECFQDDIELIASLDAMQFIPGDSLWQSKDELKAAILANCSAMGSKLTGSRGRSATAIREAINLLRGYGLSFQADQILERYYDKGIPEAITYSESLMADLDPNGATPGMKPNHDDTEPPAAKPNASEEQKQITLQQPPSQPEATARTYEPAKGRGAASPAFAQPAIATVKEGEGNGRTKEIPEPLLGERAQLVLTVLWNEMAFDSDHRIRTSDIAAKAAGASTDPNQYKEVVANLGRLGYLVAKEGRGGGCWLTTNGQRRASKL